MQWLSRQTCDPADVGSIPTTDHFVISLEKQLTYVSSVHPPTKRVPGTMQLICGLIVICARQDAIL